MGVKVVKTTGAAIVSLEDAFTSLERVGKKDDLSGYLRLLLSGADTTEGKRDDESLAKLAAALVPSGKKILNSFIKAFGFKVLNRRMLSNLARKKSALLA